VIAKENQMDSFQPRECIGSTETYATALHMRNSDLALFVSADSYRPASVRLALAHNHGSVSANITEAQARLLAAELIAAADSLAIPVGQVTELEAA